MVPSANQKNYNHEVKLQLSAPGVCSLQIWSVRIQRRKEKKNMAHNGYLADQEVF